MKLLILFLYFFATLFASINVNAQSVYFAQLKDRMKQLQQNPGYQKDTAYINIVNQLATIYADNYPDSALVLLQGQEERCKLAGYKKAAVEAHSIAGNAFQTKGNYDKALACYEKAYKLAEEINYTKAFPSTLNNIGLIYLNKGNYPVALQHFYEALKTADAGGDKFVKGSTLNNIANVHFYQGKMEEASADYKKMLAIARSLYDTSSIILAYNNIGEVCLQQNKLTEALNNLQTGYNLAVLIKSPEMLVSTTRNLGYVYYKMDSLPKALSYFEEALTLSEKQGNTKAACKALIGLATVQEKAGLLKDALSNSLKAAGLAAAMGQAQLIRDANEKISVIYEKSGDGNNALKHYKIFKIYSDSISNVAGERAAATYKADYEFSKKELVFQRQALQQRWLIFSAFAALLTLCVIVWMINRNRRRLDVVNKTLHQNNLLIEAQKTKAEETLDKLRAAQAQLVQSEKMASLGELTAGIAHEIQNPLNFVNNFSEVSKELLDEMKTALDNGDTEDAKDIATDVIQNLEKINHHGKRADAIVKGMLQHSQSTTGTKEPTDINALCDEYLRLSYHGLRAKDKTFNATIKTDFDSSIGKVNIIPQDIGRVILNLLTNAFYAVQQKALAQEKSTFQTLPSLYQPAVSISTKKEAGKVLITVSDNGNGIPQNIVDKIFQPFFTTKPTGQGTGLGLSLSYDIIKVHGGSIMINANNGAETVFKIELPIIN